MNVVCCCYELQAYVIDCVSVNVQVVSAAAWACWTDHVIRRQASAAARVTTGAQTVTSVQRATTATRHATVRNC